MKSIRPLEAVAEGVKAIAPGLTLENILKDIGTEMTRMGVQGQMELASALFGNGAFVLYGPGQYTPSSEKTLNQAISEHSENAANQQEQSRGGMER